MSDVMTPEAERLQEKKRGVAGARGKQREWILAWLGKNSHQGIGTTNEKFHDEFWNEFGGAREWKLWGASPVKKAMQRIREMEREGLLERHKFGLCTAHGHREQGFPSWTYDYTLPGFLRKGGSQ